MRRLKWIGTPRCILAGALVALLAALVVEAPVSGASDESTATAAKKKPKKCKKARWKCAPKLYYLEAVDSYETPYVTQNSAATVLLRKRRAGPGEVDYSQMSGQVRIDGGGTGLDDHCLTDPEHATWSVSRQWLNVPPVDFGIADFNLAFKLLGKEKNTYGLTVGDVQPETSNIVGEVNVTCPDATTHNDPYPYTDPAHAVRALVARGKVGTRFLEGGKYTTYETHRGTARDVVQWELRSLCGKVVCRSQAPK